VGSHNKTATLNRLRSTIQSKEANNAASHIILEAETLEDRFSTLEREDQIERLLEDLKSRQPRLT
jgi:phage shock protein A